MARFGREDEGYDGRFRSCGCAGTAAVAGRQRQRNAWNHDYPRAEANLARILQELTLIDVNPEGRILGLDDLEVFNYPILYMWEPGFWIMTDRQGEFREHLLKGGVRDLRRLRIRPVEQPRSTDAADSSRSSLGSTRRVTSHLRFVLPDGAHRLPSTAYGIKPTYYGIFEDNDSSKRLMVIANHNHDVAEYWEFSDQGLWPIDLSNEVAKLGVNYMVYGLIH